MIPIACKENSRFTEVIVSLLVVSKTKLSAVNPVLYADDCDWAVHHPEIKASD